jgi:multiple sugar transport system substrate-binding protein
MRTRLSAILGVAGLLLIPTACGGGAGELVTADRVGSEDAENTMSLQINAGYSPQAGIPSWAEGFQAAYTKWAEANPDWQIDLTVVPDAQATSEQAQLLEAAGRGDAPDCAAVDSFVLTQFIEQGSLAPLDEHFTDEEVADMFPFVREGVTGEDGHIYAAWWNTGLPALFRRTDLVPAAPQTWDELIESALAAEEENVDGYLYSGARDEGTVFMNLPYFWSQGGDLVDEQGAPAFGEGANREALVDFLTFLQTTVESGASPERVSTVTPDQLLTQAQSGNVAMFLGQDYMYGQMEEMLPPEEFEKWEVSTLPTESTTDEPVATAGGWTVASFSDDPEKVKMCMDFVKSVYIGAGNTITGQLPTFESLYQELEAFDAPIFDTWREMLRSGRARPSVASYPGISTQLQVAIGEVLSGQRSPEEAVDEAANAVE